MSGNDLNLPEGSTQEKDDLTKLYTRMQQENGFWNGFLRMRMSRGCFC